VLVKNLESVETLGSTSCICSDKTGTLTQNVMTIENLFYDGKILKADNLEKKGPKFNYAYDRQSVMFRNLQEAVVCNTSGVFSSTPPDRVNALLNDYKGKTDAASVKKYDKIMADWQEEYKNMPYWQRATTTDASETALIKFFQPIKDIENLRMLYPTAKNEDGSDAEVKFNSKHKFSAIVRDRSKGIVERDGCKWIAFLKGAPERVWDQCSYIMIDGKPEILDEYWRDKIEEANKTFAKMGQRVLGFANMVLPKEDFPENHKFAVKGPYELNLPKNGFCFVGLMSIIDPPRDTVPDSIAKCKTAGIKVIMVTGDQQLTASAISKQIGILEGSTSIDLWEKYPERDYAICVNDSQAIVVNGDMLNEAYLEDDGLPENEKGKKLEKWLSKPQIVFARTSPVQKHYIVKGCQKLGYVVAVTGDGVNDSPAIKQADIGLAMGITGSEVAKDSADMI